MAGEFDTLNLSNSINRRGGGEGKRYSSFSVLLKTIHELACNDVYTHHADERFYRGDVSDSMIEGLIQKGK
jgi:hypothetical protein